MKSVLWIGFRLGLSIGISNFTSSIDASGRELFAATGKLSKTQHFRNFTVLDIMNNIRSPQPPNGPERKPAVGSLDNEYLCCWIVTLLPPRGPLGPGDRGVIGARTLRDSIFECFGGAHYLAEKSIPFCDGFLTHPDPHVAKNNSKIIEQIAPRSSF